jgi:predicted nucleic acid-binding protein
MKKALLDTNVVLDFALAREKFLDNVIKILLLVAEKKVTVYVSASSITDIYYILSKAESTAKALSFIRELVEITEIATVDKMVVQTALAYNFKDFEDAVQLATSQHSALDYLITRNEKDFLNHSTAIEVYSPEQFLNIMI